jgi:hypothetical protein|tara:strand:- start:148 stop:465 length:318 start_codon:yes stop_codon:yes gene_type:complete
MKDYSTINKLKDQNIINDQLLVCINKLSLEDLIAIKLELSTNLLNNRLYGLDIWNKMDSITKEALLKFSLSVTKTKADASRFLGITQQNFNRICKTYKVFENEII